MGKNFAKRLDEMKREHFVDGMETGKQLMFDTIAEVLHDPDVMGKGTFSRDRLAKLLTTCAEHYDYWLGAVLEGETRVEDERTGIRKRLDDKLQNALGDHADLPFEVRYPYLKDVDI